MKFSKIAIASFALIAGVASAADVPVTGTYNARAAAAPNTATALTAASSSAFDNIQGTINRFRAIGTNFGYTQERAYSDSDTFSAYKNADGTLNTSFSGSVRSLKAEGLILQAGVINSIMLNGLSVGTNGVSYDNGTGELTMTLGALGAADSIKGSTRSEILDPAKDAFRAAIGNYAQVAIMEGSKGVNQLLVAIDGTPRRVNSQVWAGVDATSGYTGTITAIDKVGVDTSSTVTQSIASVQDNINDFNKVRVVPETGGQAIHLINGKSNDMTAINTGLTNASATANRIKDNVSVVAADLKALTGKFSGLSDIDTASTYAQVVVNLPFYTPDTRTYDPITGVVTSGSAGLINSGSVTKETLN